MLYFEMQTNCQNQTTTMGVQSLRKWLHIKSVAILVSREHCRESNSLAVGSNTDYPIYKLIYTF